MLQLYYKYSELDKGHQFYLHNAHYFWVAFYIGKLLKVNRRKITLFPFLPNEPDKCKLLYENKNPYNDCEVTAKRAVAKIHHKIKSLK